MIAYIHSSFFRLISSCLEEFSNVLEIQQFEHFWICFIQQFLFWFIYMVMGWQRLGNLSPACFKFFEANGWKILWVVDSRFVEGFLFRIEYTKITWKHHKNLVFWIETIAFFHWTNLWIQSIDKWCFDSSDTLSWNWGSIFKMRLMLIVNTSGQILITSWSNLLPRFRHQGEWNHYRT